MNFFKHFHLAIFNNNVAPPLSSFSQKETLDQLKPYAHRMHRSEVYFIVVNFDTKKIIPICNTKIFTNDSGEKISYAKNSNKELECFIELDLHPETGKILKPIIKYIIDIYACEQSKVKSKYIHKYLCLHFLFVS